MARFQFANVLNVGPDTRKLWQFNASGDFPLNREFTAQNGEPLPDSLVAKTWRTLLNPKLNIAWLPSDKVFLRVVQLPVADFAETLAMIELQLEKLSPLPVAQIAWTIEILPQKQDNQQNIIVVIVARSLVEEFLGQLETQGYLADRLETPVLDQLLATRADSDGIWLYGGENPDSPFLVAWWYGGILRNIGILPAISEGDTSALRDQIAQMAWAGELEGWLTAPPQWHLVADAEKAAKWEPIFTQWAEQPIQVITPVVGKDLAALSAKRAAKAPESANLVPADYRTRYHQQNVDRLWMRGVFAIFVIYSVGVLIYLSALQVLKFQRDRQKTQFAGISQQYTNTVHLHDRLQILEDQSNLKYAALDCWKVASDLLPQELTLTQMTFQGGKKLMLYGTVQQEQLSKLTDYYEALSRTTINGQTLALSPMNSSAARPGSGGGSLVTWSFVCELRSKGGGK